MSWPACEQVGLTDPVSITVTFSTAIDSLYMALLSVGQSGLAVTYDFSAAFTIDSEGAGFLRHRARARLAGAGQPGVAGAGALSRRRKAA